MTKSLAELRMSTRTTLPERSLRLCLSGDLVAEVQALTEEQFVLEAKLVTTNDEGEQVGPPKRLGSTNPNAARLAEISARLLELWNEMDDHTGEVRLRALENGAWRRWVDEHPPRPGNPRDTTIAYDICNADELIDELGLFVHTWNGDRLAEGDWAFMQSKLAGGDVKELARTVVMMHELAVDLPKLRSASLSTLESASD